MSRRRFLRSLAAAPLLPSALSAHQAPTPSLPAPASPTPPVPSPSPSPPGPVAQALAEVVRLRYGSQLEEADLAQVRKGIEDNPQAAERLHKGVKLGNADAPVNLFHPRLTPPPAPPTTRRRRRR